MIRVPVALFNYERGGQTASGGYDFRPLQHAFSDVDEPPDPCERHAPLVNDAMLPHLIPGSYRVHVPDGPPYPSDHRLVTAAVDL